MQTENHHRRRFENPVIRCFSRCVVSGLSHSPVCAAAGDNDERVPGRKQQQHKQPHDQVKTCCEILITLPQCPLYDNPRGDANQR